MSVLAERALSLHEEHLVDTRRAIVAAARHCFATSGYTETSLDDITGEARVTRGAFYHPYDSNAAVFALVVEQVENEFIDRLVAAGAPGATVWESIVNGCLAYLDVALDPEIQQIVLRDGPTVLGWQAWRQVQERYGFGLLSKWLTLAMDRDFLPTQPVEPLAYLLTGALNEAALHIAQAPDRAQARAEMGAALTGILGLLGRPIIAANGGSKSAS
jgi:AcrR family transcriptional regulator